MHDSAKYLIHADIEASGVVERSDVVGAIFGQTEGLLGDELDLRELQDSGRLGRIEVEVDSVEGRSYGSITIASGLDRVETAILGAALESIDRVGPCRADVEVTDLEDARVAKRRQVVDRATELLAEFDETALSSQDIVEEVRRAVRVEDVIDFHGLPAGPRVPDTDAVVVVEGRSDVLTLLEYGVKNAIAVEGTNVPDAVADLTRERTVTAFLDGDRGGDLILKELAQVGHIDYVALAPPDRSVEDLSREEVLTALREKVPFETVDDGTVTASTERESRPATDGTTDPVTSPDSPSGAREDGSGTAETAGDASKQGGGPDTDGAGDTAGTDTGDGVLDADTTADAGDGATTDADATSTGGREAAGVSTDETATPSTDESGETGDTASADETGDEGDDEPGPQTLAGHVEAVVGGETGLARALDADWNVVDERPGVEAFELLESLETAPAAVVVDGELSQRVLDVAAQLGVEQVVCATEGEYVKQPADVRVRTAARL